jgi:NodT family efflux transporter outer membrane factor (OMF) lipoprotein
MKSMSLKSMSYFSGPSSSSRRRRALVSISLAVALAGSTACTVGPKYHRPSAPVPPSFKELPAPNSPEASVWKEAQPSDEAIRGKWWEVYKDPQLNALEEQVDISNQNILAAKAQFLEAVYSMKIARSALFPVVGSTVSATRSRTAVATTGATVVGATRNTYDATADFSYQADVWGSIRRQVRASTDTAQASFAQLENARLSYQAALAQAYFELRGVDEQQNLLEQTVKSYEDYLQLTQYRLKAGVVSGIDVAQAETQLDSTRAALVDLGVSRAQFEHAIAVLTGKPPAEVSIARNINPLSPPAIPVAFPSTLLQRRPDVASFERIMAANNEEIGVAKAAFFPSVLLNASAGLVNGDISQWFSWPSRVWAVGAQAAETIFEGGRRHAQVKLSQATYDASVANYRQTVLTAFQQVEDNLAALRQLSEEAKVQDAAVQASQSALDISTYQYKAGTVSYLQVLTSQTASLQAETTAVSIRTRRMVSSVLLIEALGGGWDAAKIPSHAEMMKD